MHTGRLACAYAAPGGNGCGLPLRVGGPQLTHGLLALERRPERPGRTGAADAVGWQQWRQPAGAAGRSADSASVAACRL